MWIRLIPSLQYSHFSETNLVAITRDFIKKVDAGTLLPLASLFPTYLFPLLSTYLIPKDSAAYLPLDSFVYSPLTPCLPCLFVVQMPQAPMWAYPTHYPGLCCSSAGPQAPLPSISLFKRFGGNGLYQTSQSFVIEHMLHNLNPWFTNM